MKLQHLLYYNAFIIFLFWKTALFYLSPLTFKVDCILGLLLFAVLLKKWSFVEQFYCAGLN
jgi:hypothetical protein